MEKIITRSSLYDPLDDFFFYKVMGEKGDEVQLLAFINAVLGKTGEESFSSIEILEDKKLTPDVIGGKTGILDVRAVLHGSKRVNVEVQLQDQQNMDRRSLFYLSREYTRWLKEGEDYIELPDIIGINIVNFNFPQTKHYHSSFHLREDTERDIILTNALEIHYINMVKYRRQKNKDLNDPLCRWLVWFNKNSPSELIEEVVNMDSAIQVAAERMLNLTVDEDVITLRDRMFMASCDRTSQINCAHSKGMEKGMEKEKILIAKNMLNKGSSIEFIHEITGLGLDRIRKISKKSSNT
jgi:predicted transposase/invertase (TIGR01784 family)